MPRRHPCRNLPQAFSLIISGGSLNVISVSTVDTTDDYLFGKTTSPTPAPIISQLDEDNTAGDDVRGLSRAFSHPCQRLYHRGIYPDEQTKFHHEKAQQGCCGLHDAVGVATYDKPKSDPTLRLTATNARGTT